MSWKIFVERGNLSFSAAHFITLEGSHEPLHGHNYGICAELTGETLTSDSYLLDFGIVKQTLREFIREVNHRFLLPLLNPHMTITHTETEWEIRLYDGSRFVIPDASVVALDLDNITAERLAEYFASRLVSTLHDRGYHHLTTVTIGIAETDMQTAYHTIAIDR